VKKTHVSELSEKQPGELTKGNSELGWLWFRVLYNRCFQYRQYCNNIKINILSK
jgi:hypothetical protein